MRTSTWAYRATAAATASITALAVIATPAHAQDSTPKNIIYMIGDGMGYNHLVAANLWQTGQSRYQLTGENDFNAIAELLGEPVQVYENWDKVSMSTFQAGNTYDKQLAWSDREWIKKNFTDSAAAATAMATGVKTNNGTIGIDPQGTKLENTAQRAVQQGKSAGVVTSVPFNHATPAGWGAHNANRNAYQEMANEMLNGDLSVIMGAGHPYYDDNAQRLDAPKWKYISEADYNALNAEDSTWRVITDQADFESLAKGVAEGDDKVFGLAPVADTLQQKRSGEDYKAQGVAPYTTAFNEGVADLATMSLGALNVLNQNDKGFQLMIEGGAIDWSGHDNSISRDIEETIAFNEAVAAVNTWVEENSSWDETLVVVTADHETGYLTGPEDPQEFSALTGAQGETPIHNYLSGDHTNQLVPFFFKGAGAGDIKSSVVDTDKVRGAYIDNTTIARLTLDKWWADKPADDRAPGDNTGDDKDGSSVEELTPSAILNWIIAGLTAVLGFAQSLRGLAPTQFFSSFSPVFNF